MPQEIKIKMKINMADVDKDLNVYEYEVQFSGTNVISFLYTKEKLEPNMIYDVTLTPHVK